MNQLIEPEEKVNVAIEILAMVQHSYEQFSIRIYQFYKRYHSTVPCLIKQQVNNENKVYFGMYFVMGLLHDDTGRKDELLWN
ncbi:MULTISPECIES: hypothetical protein [Bacillaceae]|uniref:Uncharacterized protein n=1 Tax=Oceanobacillus caeni TaxID=405946 RepID=A0ABR5MKZ5_9BACI|nr:MULTISPECIES: hypothetical protein [Bacillaceae]KPH76567.1 hypothetical protein AFL42_05670 [Oceanobacillus caeni]